MDPDVNLKEQRDLARRILACVEAHSHEPMGGTAGFMLGAEALAGLVVALDNWIATGGFLPKRWEDEEDAR